MPDAGILDRLGGEAVALLLLVWMLGNWCLKALEIYRATKQRTEIKEAAACSYPPDLAQQTRESLHRQAIFAAQQQAAVSELHNSIGALVEALNRSTDKIDRGLERNTEKLIDALAEVKAQRQNYRPDNKRSS
jgi:hypothetical protein